MTQRRFPLRRKLALATLAPLTAALLVCSSAGLWLIDSRITAQAQDKVRTDLNAAREVYRNEGIHLLDVVKLAAASFPSGAPPERIILPLGKGERLDFLSLAAPSGEVIYRSGSVPGGIAPSFALRALRGEVVSGTVVLTPEQIGREGEDLAIRSVITPVPTPYARSHSSVDERSALVLVAAAPVTAADGTITGALYGGILLNNNTSLVDTIKQIVFEGVITEGRDVGTATIFLDDLRIATNVKNADGRRAVGTRLSAEVYRHVMEEGHKWVGRAFVVDDWYLTAYEPITDLNGRRVGSFYVGMLETPYRQLKLEVAFIFGLVLLGGTLIGLAVSGFAALRLARPVKELEMLARRVATGERGVRSEVRTADEIGDLALEFNQMSEALEAREQEVRELNRDLEKKVEERTAELEKTREELVRAARLADLGIMAAGVAHEINNPLAVIRGNAELLEMSTPADDSRREEIEIIRRQTDRMATIVRNLLTFARQKKINRGRVFLHPLLDDILANLGHQVPLRGVTVTRDYDPSLESLSGDADQLRQVFTNLLLNAVQAMANGGELTVATVALPDEYRISVSDTGRGIAPGDRDKIFTPFFTTRQSGSGLGLAVSYGIVTDHGGEIEVESTPGSGTTFRVVLPARPPENGAGPAPGGE